MKNTSRDDALAILDAGIRRVDPRGMIERTVQIDDDRIRIMPENTAVTIDLTAFTRILVIGAGKATAAMARGLETVLGDRIDEGIIAVKPGHTEPLQRIRTIEAEHPVPGQGSVDAASAILACVAEADEKTLVINLVSGGGSALLTRPYQDAETRITLEEMQQTTATLLACGATIQEINCVRKHLSSIKGGRLAAVCAPARVVSLILSDVVGDDLSSIASGLTAPDRTTFADVDVIFRKYAIGDQIPSGVMELVSRGRAGAVPDTPGPDDPVFRAVSNVLIGSNALALSAAAEEARRRGYQTVVLSSQITGEAREIARFYAGIARDLVRFSPPDPVLSPRPACIIAGGETTVTLRGSGRGGRNQEMALAFLAEFLADPEELKPILFLSGATDGNDGPTDAAGGIADILAIRNAVENGEDVNAVLAASDAYHGLERVGGLVKTGPTNTNVCDIQIILAI